MNNYNASPLSQDQFDKFIELTRQLNDVQLAWMSGYLTALTTRIEVHTNTPTVQNKVTISTGLIPITILFGSRTGNGEGVAKKAQKLATEFGLSATMKNMDNYTCKDIQKEKNLLVIVSTHGEGEPPFAARELHEFIFSKRASRIENVNFAVLGLGDSSYQLFCQTGKDFDRQLERLGAKRLTDIECCDIDFEESAERWLRSTLRIFSGSACDNASVINGENVDIAFSQNYSKMQL